MKTNLPGIRENVGHCNRQFSTNDDDDEDDDEIWNYQQEKKGFFFFFPPRQQLSLFKDKVTQGIQSMSKYLKY